MHCGSLLGRSSTAAAGMYKRRLAAKAVRRASRSHLSAVGPDPSEAEEHEDQDDLPSTSTSTSTSTERAHAGCERGSGSFRFWHDERRFKGRGDKCIVQKALFRAGGVRTGGYPKAAPIPGPLGHQRSEDWDLLWSPARSALKAATSVKAGQLISAMPGMYSLTKKRRMTTTLQEAYGEDAWTLAPLSFSLPADLGAWRAWLDQHAAAGTDPGPWMLKTAQHLGKGLKLLPGEEAYAQALLPRAPVLKPFVVAQRYVDNPLLIQGRKFGVRLWVLVTGHSPLRVYMHTNGLALFSSTAYAAGMPDADEDGGQMLGHVTNYAQNVDGMVWDMEQLANHLGQKAFQQLWQRLQQNTAKVFCAPLGKIRREHMRLNLPHNSTFELLGLDYLIDADLQPWLLEVNGTPSLAVEHSSPEVEALIAQQKGGMVRDMVSLLNCGERFQPRYALIRSALKKNKLQVRKIRELLLGSTEASIARLVEGELANCGHFQPLMPLYPFERAASGQCSIAFSEHDRKLRENSAGQVARVGQKRKQTGLAGAAQATA